MKTRTATLIGAATLAACSSPAPTPAPQPTAAPTQNRPANPTLPPGFQVPGQGGDSNARPGLPTAQPRPYNRVITAEAKTRRGLFAVHRVGDRLYFEIPAKELNKDQLIVGRYARAAASTPTPTGGGFGDFAGNEFGERTLRWERNGNHVILRSPSFAVTADTALAVYRAVQNSN
jgi:hypothetical protein